MQLLTPNLPGKLGAGGKTKQDKTKETKKHPPKKKQRAGRQRQARKDPRHVLKTSKTEVKEFKTKPKKKTKIGKERKE
jgi:hypothetical protein